MASDCDSEENYPSNPEDSDEDYQKPTLAETKPNVAELLKQLQSSGALVKKQKAEYKCVTCKTDYKDWTDLENHLFGHVSMPDIILERCDEGFNEEDDAPDDWSDTEEPEIEQNKKSIPGITEILKNSGITLKKPEVTVKNENNSALSKLASLGILKKTPNSSVENSPIKPASDVMQKLGQIGGLKLKLKQNDDNKSFHIVNGVKQKIMDDSDIKNDEDDDEWASGDEKPPSHGSEDADLEDEDLENKESEEDEPESEKTELNKTVNKQVQQKVEPAKVTEIVSNKEIVNRAQQQVVNSRKVNDNNKNMTANEIVVKEEPEDGDKTSYGNAPILIGQIKTESPPSPPPLGAPAKPVQPTASIKEEIDPVPGSDTRVPLFNNQQTQPVLQTVPTPIAIVEPKKEAEVIEINGDSGDEDDDCCVVSATPADIKPKIEEVVYPTSSTNSVFPTSRPGPTILSSKVISTNQYTTEKQHNFNWNAPDHKQPIVTLQNSTDAMFDTLFSSPSKKEGYSLDTTSEYVSLDTLGAQHSCQVCNTKFTSLSLLESHKIATGHSTSLILTKPGTLMPSQYGSPSSSLLDNLLGGKLLPVTRQTTSQPFTHQQNVLINIQSYPGAMGQQTMGQPYNPYAQQPQAYPGQSMPGQFTSPYGQQNVSYQPQAQQQFQPQPGQQAPFVQQNFPQTPGQAGQYSAGFQQPGMQPGQQYGIQHNMQASQQMPPPATPPHGQPYSPSSPSKQNIRIQNVQSFGPNSGMLPGQTVRPRNMSPMRARAPGPALRPGMRPSVRPGLHVQGQQMRGKVPPRMPMKRPGQMPAGPMPKRKPDMLLPGRHENDDCQTMSIQKQREGLPLISSIQGSKLGSEISITKKKVSPAAAVANALAARGISVKAKPKSPSPERTIPHIPGLGAGVSIKHTPRKTSDGFTIPEARMGGYVCKICKRSFPSEALCSTHMANAHSTHKCPDCPATYPTLSQLQHHRRAFHNEMESSRELGLPVVDLTVESNLRRLADLGIYNFIPLANREEVNGCFGIPVVSTRNASSAALSSLGAHGVLSLGPLKSVPNT